MTGVGILLRSHLRRDRWIILWWCLGGVLLYWSQAVSIEGLYATQAEFDQAAAAMDDNAAFIAMAGPARALDTVGGQVAWQATAFGAVVAGLMSMFLIGRHSRAEEESGRDELVRSAAIDRRAPVSAALIVALVANLLLGVLVTLSLLTVRSEDAVLKGLPLPVADSIGIGLGLTACGWVFSGVALVAAQLTQSTRAMYGLAGSVIGVAYGLRAVGDVGNEALSWLSPIGWYQAMHPYSGLRWWPALLMIAAACLTAAAAFAVFGRRDIGSGLLADRPGPAEAGSGLRSGLGLAWRLQRGSVYGWSAGLFLTGLSYGSIGDSVEDLVGDSEFAEAFGAGVTDSLVEGFYAVAIVQLALIACGFAISSTLRPRAEEDAGHSEVLLATGLSRRSWLAGHVLVTVAGTAALLTLGGLGLGIGYAATTGDSGAVLRYLGPVLPYLAPVLVLSAVARLLYGLWPRALVAAWLPLVLAVVVLIFGDVLQLPEWLQALSPFEHLALVPAEDFEVAPVVAVALLATLLSVGGQIAFRRRDIG
ncbi:ABC transporter permease [Nocardioides pelophilus]|uniref:ABC transporter permease n=1 Tax=Nocardioides pelophilus TaxID=2172019 RepID=UPI0015FF152E|nr:ABC transporter permease [Nocardioides pelophilus]